MSSRSIHPGDSALAARFRREIEGEVLFDAGSRGRYATDASIYQIEPVGVVVPKTERDAITAVRIALEEGVPVLPRGGGTSQCGQTVGAAVVIPRHQDSHYAIVQQGDRFFGVALDDLPFDLARVRSGACRRNVHEAASLAEVGALIEADPWAWSNDPLPPIFHRPPPLDGVAGDSRAPLVELRDAVVSVPVRPAAETLKRRLIHESASDRRVLALRRLQPRRMG